MSLETMDHIGGLIASVAVVLSLLFLALQAQLGLHMIRDAAMHAHTDKLQSISRALFETPGLADVWARGMKGMAGLSEEDRIRFTSFAFFAFRIWEEAFLQHRTGATDKALWAANIRIIRDIHEYPGVREAWALRRHNFTPAFQSFYEAHTAQGEAMPVYT